MPTPRTPGAPALLRVLVVLSAVLLGSAVSARPTRAGTISVFAGAGDIASFSGDGGPAIRAGLSNPNGIAAGPDGSLYIADSGHYRIRQVSGLGSISTVAGNGQEVISGGGSSGDGGPATEASLYPQSLAVASSGDLYSSDPGNLAVRKVDANRLISTVVDQGTPEAGEDPEEGASLDFPDGVAVAPDGSLYIADSCRILRLADGVLTTVAGGKTTRSCGYFGDGGPATNAGLSRYGSGKLGSIGFGGDGSLYIADSANNRIRKVSSGIITTVAGNGGQGSAGDGGPATRAELNQPRDVAVASDGSLYIADTYKVRRVTPSGNISTVAGSGRTSGGIPGPALEAGFETHFVEASGSSVYFSTVGGQVLKLNLNDAEIGLRITRSAKRWRLKARNGRAHLRSSFKTNRAGKVKIEVLNRRSTRFSIQSGSKLGKTTLRKRRASLSTTVRRAGKVNFTLLLNKDSLGEKGKRVRLTLSSGGQKTVKRFKLAK